LVATRVLTVLGLMAATGNAAWADPLQQPPSAELAKKCRALTIKAHPPVLAGMKKGDAAEERAYFAACIKKGGDPDKQ
jgi:hypothetical protein